MQQKLYSFKHQLEGQHNSRSDDLEGQYKSRIFTLEKANAVKNKEIVKKTIKILDGIIYSKDQTIFAYYDGIRFKNPGCIDDTIEPTSFYEKDARILWTKWYDDAPDDPNIRKKYTFRSHIHTKLPNTLCQR
ncbi:unnamed protein product [Rhizophagus irregularis]|nr:unnamed protein product [Rhizophagus irregularis]